MQIQKRLLAKALLTSPGFALLHPLGTSRCFHGAHCPGQVLAMTRCGCQDEETTESRRQLDGSSRVKACWRARCQPSAAASLFTAPVQAGKLAPRDAWPCTWLTGAACLTAQCCVGEETLGGLLLEAALPTSTPSCPLIDAISFCSLLDSENKGFSQCHGSWHWSP